MKTEDMGFYREALFSYIGVSKIFACQLSQHFDYAYRVNDLKWEKVPLKVQYKSTRPFSNFKAVVSSHEWKLPGNGNHLIKTVLVVFK